MADQDIIDAIKESTDRLERVLGELKELRGAMERLAENGHQEAPEWEVEPLRANRYTTKGFGHHLKSFHPDLHAKMKKRRAKGYYKDMPMWKLAIMDYDAARPQKGAPGALLCLLCAGDDP